MLKDFFKTRNLSDHVKEYIDTEISLMKIKIAEKVSKIIALLIAGAILFLLFFFSFVFLSLAAAHGIGSAIGHTWLGFLIVAFVYLLIGVIVWDNKEKIVRIPVMNAIIRQLFPKDETTDYEKN